MISCMNECFHVICRWLRKLWRKRKFCRKTNKVQLPGTAIKMNDYLERERLKPELGDFTLGEYTEKVIVYGYLVVCSIEIIFWYY